MYVKHMNEHLLVRLVRWVLQVLLVLVLQRDRWDLADRVHLADQDCLADRECLVCRPRHVDQHRLAYLLVHVFLALQSGPANLAAKRPWNCNRTNKI